MDEYGKRLLAHERAVNEVTWDLLNVAGRLCPDEWVLQIEESFSTDATHRRNFRAYVSNGDDNVSGEGNTIAAALAQLISFMLHDSVYPLTGRWHGRYIYPGDRGWTKVATEQDAPAEPPTP